VAEPQGNGDNDELRMLRELDVEDYMAVIRMIRTCYLKTVYKKEVENERKRRGFSPEGFKPT